jgi:hypothetical protein
MPATDNEKLIFNDIVNKYNPNIETAKTNHIADNLEVSLDFIWKEKDFIILLEIDSYNASSTSEWNDLVKNNRKTKLLNIIKKRLKPIN